MSSMPSSKCVRMEINMLVPASARRLQMTSSKALLQEHHGMNSSQVHLSLHESSSHGIAEHWHWHGGGGHTPGLLPPFTMRKQQESEQCAEVKQLAGDRNRPRTLNSCFSIKWMSFGPAGGKQEGIPTAERAAKISKQIQASGAQGELGFQSLHREHRKPQLTSK